MIFLISSFQKTDFLLDERIFLSLSLSFSFHPFPRHLFTSLFSTQRGPFLWTRSSTEPPLNSALQCHFAPRKTLPTFGQARNKLASTKLCASRTKQNGGIFSGDGKEGTSDSLRWFGLEKDVYDRLFLSKFPRVEIRRKSRDCFTAIDRLALLSELIERDVLRSFKNAKQTFLRIKDLDEHWKRNFIEIDLKKKIQFDFSWYICSQNLKGTYREKSLYLPNWLRERSSAKRGEELREQVLSLKNRLVTWNVFVHSKVSYKWSSIVAPQLLQSKSLPQFQWNYTAKPISFTPPPIFVHFEWKFSDRNSKFFAIIRRVVELQTRIARKYRAERCGTSLKIKSLSQIPPNPENSSPDTRFCSFFLYGQIFSSLLACSIELFMDRAFSRDFLDFFFQYFL